MYYGDAFNYQFIFITKINNKVRCINIFDLNL
jgi:hypothetical protein